MAVLTLEDIIDLKKQVKEHFGVEVHAHDACGGQSFDVAEMTPALKKFLTGYLKTKGLTPTFSDMDGQFVVN